MVNRELKIIWIAAIVLAMGIFGWYKLSVGHTGHSSGHARMSSKEAAAAGYVASGPGGIYNAEKLDTFYEDVQDGRESQLSIAHYTDEGDPIYLDLDYDGASIRYVYDSTWDAFGGQDKGVSATTCKAVEKRIGQYGEQHGTTYALSKCANDIGYSDREKKAYFLLFVPDNP